MQPSGNGDWFLDSGATSHITGNAGNLAKIYSLSKINSPSIVVGNGSHLPVTASGSSFLTSRPFHINNVLVAPSVIKNLLSVRKFTTDNSVSIEFDPYGFLVKDLSSRTPIMRSSSSSGLYPFFGASTDLHSVLLSSDTGDLWHRRLGHPCPSTLSKLSSQFPFPCNKSPASSVVCEACQLGKHTRLPFHNSISFTVSPFDLVHCDLWTSPISSCSGFKFYLIIIDDFPIIHGPSPCMPNLMLHRVSCAFSPM